MVADTAQMAAGTRFWSRWPDNDGGLVLLLMHARDATSTRRMNSADVGCGVLRQELG
jgi:hypothetical protein